MSPTRNHRRFEPILQKEWLEASDRSRISFPSFREFGSIRSIDPSRDAHIGPTPRGPTRHPFARASPIPALDRTPYLPVQLSPWFPRSYAAQDYNGGANEFKRYRSRAFVGSVYSISKRIWFAIRQADRRAAFSDTPGRRPFSWTVKCHSNIMCSPFRLKCFGVRRRS